MSSNSLFRAEALEHQKDRLTGHVLLAHPVSFTVITLFLVAIIVVALLFLFWGEYARKEVVRGYLLPSKGLIKTYAPRMGSIETLHVKEGQQVKAGEPLFTLRTEQAMVSGKDASQQRQLELKEQATLIANQKIETNKQFQNTLKGLKSNKQRLIEELAQLEAQLTALAERKSIYQEQLSDSEKLLQSGYVSKTEYLQQKQQLLASQQEEKQLKAYLAKERFDLGQVEQQIALLPSEHQQKQLELDRNLSSIEQQRLNEESSYRIVLRATAAGTVTAIQIKQGETVAATASLLTILPAGAELQAELWLPTRAAGFVSLGQQARIRFDAFPYQRFGMGSGKLAQISRSIIFPSEAQLPIQLQEPVYRVLVNLEQQHLRAYGKELPLQAGMLVEADIVLDRRNLLDWLLDPLYSLKGKV